MQPKSTPSQPGYICEACGEKYHATPYQMRNGRRFCSRACKDRGQAAFWQSRRDAIEADGEKTCTRCGETKPLDAFGKHRDGVRAKCRECMSIEFASWYTANRDYYRRYYWSHRTRLLAVQRRWKDRNHAHLISYQREYNERFRDLKRHRKRIRRMRLPETVRRMEDRRSLDRRRARIQGAPYRENVDRDALIAEQGLSCYLCDHSLTRHQVTLDHVIPLSRGGAHACRNLRVCCQSCNSKKGARLWHELRAQYPDIAERVKRAIA